MKTYQDEKSLQKYREDLMQYLNEFGLDAHAILSIARLSKGVVYGNEEDVLKQGEYDSHIYFLVSGNIIISITIQDRREVVGELGPVVLLGEISYFNKTPATARVHVTGGEDAVFLRMTYEDFENVLDTYPNIRSTLTRIGDMRVISQKDGFASYNFFMETIGWKRNRLILNRGIIPHLLRVIREELLPRLGKDDRLLEVGDGPGVLSEIIVEEQPDFQGNLYLQATHLEDAILEPLNPTPSDFSRARYLEERFEAVCTLEVFDRLPPEEIDNNLAMAKKLLKPGGMLVVIRMKLVDIPMGQKRYDTTLIFQELESLIESKFQGVLKGEPLIRVAFHDADMDPMMEWNPVFCDAVASGQLQLQEQGEDIKDVLLRVLLSQAARRIFNPEEIQFHWLAWHVMQQGLELEAQGQEPEYGFFYQLYRKPMGAD